MDYQQALNDINQISSFRSHMTLGLARIQELLHRLGNPHKHLKCIHVAGTNGKGSACAMLQQILTEHGYKTALYTSPHMMSYTERFQIDGICISEEEFAQEVAIVKTHFTNMIEEGFETPTLFEFLTAICFHYFYSKSVDIVVLETGLGGLYDATNVIENPLLCVIMSIGMDHMEFLGNTLEEIAIQKSGIIKQNVPVVLYPQNDFVYNNIAGVCKKNHSPLYDLQQCADIKIILQNLQKTVFSVSTKYFEYEHVCLTLLGEYQIQNAITVLLACDVLSKYGISLHKDTILHAIKKTQWQCRMECVKKNPTVILDGAHNIDGIDMLVRSAKTYFKNQKITLLLGILQDKQYQKMTSEVVSIADTVVITEPNNNRKLNTEKLQQVVSKFHNHVFQNNNIIQAYQTALQLTEKQDVILCCGSLYMIAELKKWIQDSDKK